MPTNRAPWRTLRSMTNAARRPVGLADGEEHQQPCPLESDRQIRHLATWRKLSPCSCAISPLRSLPTASCGGLRPGWRCGRHPSRGKHRDEFERAHEVITATTLISTRMFFGPAPVVARAGWAVSGMCHQCDRSRPSPSADVPGRQWCSRRATEFSPAPRKLSPAMLRIVRSVCSSIVSPDNLAGGEIVGAIARRRTAGLRRLWPVSSCPMRPVHQ